MTMKYAKPFLAIPDQIALLESRGMAVDDYDEAAEALHSIGYYNLSGYWYPMRQQAPAGHHRERLDDFEKGLRFSDVLDLYHFDTVLRLLMLEKIEQFEQAAKVVAAHVLAKVSPIAHTEKVFFHRRFTKVNPGQTESQYDTWLKRHNKNLTERTKQWKFAIHFFEYYEPPLPIWIAIETWDFGEISRFVQGLDRKYLEPICAHFGVRQSSVFASWLMAVGSVRNICAHHERLWNRDLLYQPKRSNDAFFDSASQSRDLWHRVYGVALVLAFLDHTINSQSNWGSRLAEHLRALPNIPGVSAGAMGLADHWDTHLAWQPRTEFVAARCV
jgi:abortive infection bacteriophage resistance protein